MVGGAKVIVDSTIMVVLGINYCRGHAPLSYANAAGLIKGHFQGELEADLLKNTSCAI